MCVAFIDEEVPLSPKFHRKVEPGTVVDKSEKFIVNGEQPDNTGDEKLTIGFASIVITLTIVLEQF